eukprot:363931-Chlamydomonas_euryale.AAC.7
MARRPTPASVTGTHGDGTPAFTGTGCDWRAETKAAQRQRERRSTKCWWHQHGRVCVGRVATWGEREGGRRAAKRKWAHGAHAGAAAGAGARGREGEIERPSLVHEGA